MARARNIKPGLFKNEILGVADPLYTLLFEGLWILADRAGRLEDRPVRIKGEVFPYRDGLDIEALLSWLVENEFIRRYTVAGKRYILICEFVKHQNPHKNEAESVIPSPEEIGTTPEEIGSTRADPLSTDSGFPLPDSLIPVSEETGGASKPARRPAVRKPEEVTDGTWMDWQQLRKAKRAPVTETVVAGARAEAAKAGMELEAFLQVWCRRGSQGLEAAWLKPEERGRSPPTQSRHEQRQETLAGLTGNTKQRIEDAERRPSAIDVESRRVD